MINVEDPTSKILANELYLDANSVLQLGDGKTLAVNSGQGTDSEGDAEGNVVVNLFDNDEAITAGFTAVDAEKLDRSSSTVGELLVGNTRSDVDKAGAAITGGSGADTIFAGAGDVVNGGGGSDLIEIVSDDTVDGYTAVQMATGGGHDTIVGFRAGFDEEDDVLSIPSTGTGNNKLTFIREANALIVALGAVRTTLVDMFSSADDSDADADTDTDADALAALADEGDELLTTTSDESGTSDDSASNDDAWTFDGSGVAQIRVEDRSNDNAITNYTVIDDKNVATVAEDADLENAVFVGIGDVAAVDFGDFESDDALVVDLNDTDKYQNIKAAMASDNVDTSIVGAAGTTGESLFAGLGNSTLDANTGGAAVMFGINSTLASELDSEKIGNTTFVYGSGYGFDTIRGFEAKTFENEDTADRIALNGEYDETVVGGMMAFDGTNLTVTLDRRNALTVADVVGGDATEANLQIRDAQYKVGSAMAFDESVTGYVANENGSIVAGEEDGVEDATLWLALGSTGEQYNIGYDNKTYTNIKDVNLSGATGDVFVAGNTAENEITGGVGTNTLWGGAGAEADTLIGVDGGTNTFAYLYNNGSDVVVTDNDDDVVDLMNIGLEEINWADVTIEDDQVALGMNDGGKIQINSSADVAIRLKNGSEWVADRENKTFTYKGMHNR